MDKFDTALVQLNKKEVIKIDFVNIRKIAHYSNQKYALLLDALEVSRDTGASNYIEDAKIDPIWRSLMGEPSDQLSDKRENITAG